jgi:16S rRNA (adenine1518-N6/adenine1519-N6)-dimethyltransferase
MQKLGQHFLKNDAVVKKIIAALDLAAGDAVIEIGPGHGELTVPLLSACVAMGASLTAIEKDAHLIDGLRKKFIEAKTSMEIEQGDALVLLLEIIEKKQKVYGVKKIKLIGNLPYYITGKLLRIISELESDQIPERCVFMIQHEVAERIVAAPPAMNRLAASVQFWADTKIIAHVPRTDFSPPPKIDSSVITLTTKIINQSTPPITPALYYEAVRAIFAQPRKTLLNNIIAINQKKLSKARLLQIIQEVGLIPVIRPQNLSLRDIINLAEILFTK